MKMKFYAQKLNNIYFFKKKTKVVCGHCFKKVVYGKQICSKACNIITKEKNSTKRTADLCILQSPKW